MSGLRTRRPTGQVAWPLILVEGGEKTGKSYAAYSMSADDRFGRVFVFGLGESTPDEYARLGPYEIVEHNGTYTDFFEQLRAACAEPSEPGKPNVVVIDSATALWGLLKDWVDSRARNSRAGREKLKADPDAEIDASMNLWNDAKDRWAAVLNLLRGSAVVGVLIGRAGEVAKVQNGQPVAGQTEYRIEAEKSTPYAVKAQVRMTKPHTATLVSVWSLDVDLPRQGLRLPDDKPLGHLVFEVLGCGVSSGASQITHGAVGMPVLDAKHRLLSYLQSQGVPSEREVARRLWAQHGTDASEIPADQLTELMEAASRHVDAVRANGGATDTQKGGDDGPASGGDAAPSGDGADGHDVGRTEPEPAPSPDRGEGTAPPAASPRPTNGRTVNRRDVATLAREVFAKEYEATQRPNKGKVLDRLRHGVVYAATDGRRGSVSTCDPDELLSVWTLLNEIAARRASWTANPLDDAAGMTVTLPDGSEVSVLWAELDELAPAEAVAS